MKRFCSFRITVFPLVALLAAVLVERANAATFFTRNTQGGAEAGWSALWTNATQTTVVAPTAGNAYVAVDNGTAFGSTGPASLNNTRIRNLTAAAPQTFPGDSLTLNTNTEFRFKTVNSSINFPGVSGNPGFILNGGAMNAGDDYVFPIDGLIQVTAPSLVIPADQGAGAVLPLRGFNFRARLIGNAPLMVVQAGTQIAQDVTSVSNTFSGGWIVKAGWLRGSGVESLGSGDITVDPNFAISFPGGTVLSNGPAQVEFMYDINSPGTLTLANGGKLILHQNARLGGLVINGTPLANGTYTYTDLAATYPNNFASGGSGSIRIGPPSPNVTMIAPLNNSVFYTASNGFTFTATSGEVIDTNHITVVLNGVNVSSSLSINGNNTNVTVRYNGLTSNTVYTGTITATNNSGATVATVRFDTFVRSGVLVIEAEDYNYGDGDCTTPSSPLDSAFGGLFIDNPAPGAYAMIPGGPAVGTVDADYHDNGTTRGNTNLYRSCDYVGTIRSGDVLHPPFTNGGFPDFDLAQVQTNEWWNYTRTVPAGNYAVYLRVSSSGAQSVRMDKVAGDISLPGQTLTAVGTFVAPNNGGAYRYVQLTDALGSNAVVNFTGGQATVRLTALGANNDLQPNYLVFSRVAAGAPPSISSRSPAPGATNVPLDTIVTVSIANGATAVSPGTIQLRFNGTNVTASAAISNSAQGVTITYDPPGQIAGSTTYPVSIQFSDTATPPVVVSNSWSFTTIAGIAVVGIEVPTNRVAKPASSTAGAGLRGEYWKRPPVSIATDGTTNPTNRVDEQIKRFGTATGTFTARGFVYLGNDLTPITNWLAGDGASFVGPTNNLDDAAFRFTGFINITNPSVLNIGLNSDDGSRIQIGGIDIINNDGSHGDQTRDTNVTFQAAGLYPIEITYFNGDWTSDNGPGGIPVNHSGSTDPSLHGGANFHLRLNGADITAAGATILHPPSAGGLIVNVVETGGDNEATDTIPAKWTGQTFVTGIADEPVPGKAANAPYTAPVFGNHAPCYVDRNHRYTNASDTVLIPSYLIGADFIMSGNDNRDNAGYLLDVTVSQPVVAYLLIDNRLSDTSAANPPTFDATHMQWVLDQGWVPVITRVNRTGDSSVPDEVGIDEGADGTINNWFSIYAKTFPAGTFQLRQPDNAGQNMYGVVVKAGTTIPTVPAQQPPYAAAVLADGPIAYYRFNESGTVAANSGTGGAAFNGTYLNGAVAGTEAPKPPALIGFETNNTAVQLNGTNAYVTTVSGLLNSRTNFTISGWIRRNGTQNARTGLWGQNDIVEFGYIDNSTLQLWTDAGLNLTPNPFPDGQWAYVAVVGQGTPGTARMYTNGVLAVTRAHTLPANNTFPFNIGGGGVFDTITNATGQPTGNYFNGQIDEVAVFDKALTSAQIATHYFSTVASPPMITRQPVGTNTFEGATVVLSVEVAGPGPFRYQWLDFGSPIAGQTNATLVFSNATVLQSSTYSVIVSNAFGSVTSADADVLIQAQQPPTITQQPQSITKYAGANATLSVVASGGISLRYQWQRSGTNVAGATNASLAFPSVQPANAGSYRVVVSNTSGSLTSQVATITVIVPVAGSYEEGIAALAPLAYWRFNETSGNIAFDSYGNNHATYTNTATNGIVAPRSPQFPGFEANNLAAQFDGVSGFVQGPVGLMNNLTNFTMVGWIRRGTNQANRTGLFGQNDVAEFGYINNTTLELWTQNGLDITPNPFPNGEWSHVAVVAEGSPGTKRMYTNGVFAGSQTHTIPGTSVFTYNIGGGGIFDATGNFFNGQIDDVAVFNKALTAAQIGQLYTRGSGKQLPALLITISRDNIIEDSKPSGARAEGANFGASWSVRTNFDNVSITRTGVMQFVSTELDQIVIPTNSFNTNFNASVGTIMFWMRSSGVNSNSGNEGAILFDRRPAGPGGAAGDVIVQYDTGNIFVQAASGSGGANSFRGTRAISDNRWHHIAYAYNQAASGSISIYVDGTLDLSQTNSRAWAWTPTQRIELGRSHDAYWRTYNGVLDDFRVYNRVLTQAEIAQVASSDAIVDPAALQVRFNFSGPPNGVMLTWPPGSVLQRTGVVGPAANWTDVSNAASPFILDTRGASNGFFRVRQ